MELYDYGARWYDPGLGRFLSPDTIIPDPTNPQSLNRYSYVLNNPLKYIDPNGHQTCENGESDCHPLLPPKKEEDNNKNIIPQSSSQNPEREWDWIPDGGRIEASGWLPGLPVIGADVNIDLVSANWDPNETSIVVGGSILIGIGEGVSGTVGPLWNDAESIEEYKTISNNGSITAIPAAGLEVNGAISGSTGAKLLYVGVGGGEEFSAGYGKQLVTLDVFRGDLTLGGEVYNIRFNLWDNLISGGKAP